MKNSVEPIRAVKDLSEQMKHFDQRMKELPEQLSSKFARKPSEDDRQNLRQVPLSQSNRSEPTRSDSDGEKANLIANLLTLQNSLDNGAENVRQEDSLPFLRRLEQTPIVQNDRELNGVRPSTFLSSTGNAICSSSNG